MDGGKLNTEQEKAVKHGMGPLLVVAGAGTGKTEVITRRIAHLVKSGRAKPDEIVALTFTDKAAREMEERVDRLLPMGVFGARIMTFHAFGGRLLDQYGLEIGLPLSMTLLNQSQQAVFLRDHLDSLNLKYFAPLAKPDSHIFGLVAYFSKLRNEMITPKQYIKYASGLKKQAATAVEKLEAAKQMELASAYAKYGELKLKAGKIDHDDQLHLVIELLDKRPNVLKDLQRGIKYLLVDEYQDTNLAQNHLLRLLCGPGANITVVGDDDQSIYKFRGAAVSNIIRFTQSYPQAQQAVLTKNYRSTQEILDSAYRLIQHNNPDRLEVQNKINKYLVATDNGEPPRLLLAATLGQEADLVASDIKERLKHGVKAGEIAVLVRKRSSMQPLAQSLAAQQVPFQIGDAENLYERPEINILLQFLQWITDPSDSRSLYHLLAGEIFNREVKQLADMAGQARRTNRSLEEVLRESGEYREFFEMADSLREKSRRLSAGELLFEFLDVTGFLKRLNREAKEQPRAEQKLKNLGRFFGKVSDFEKAAEDKSALSFVWHLADLTWAGERQEAAPFDPLADQVRVMTIHQAKGLEFDSVYLFNLSKGNFPSNRRSDPLAVPDELVSEEILPSGDWHIQEERRLMYVAMTRARSNLVLSFSPDHGGKLMKKPSPFILEALGIEAADIKPPEAKAQEVIERFRPTELKPQPLKFASGDWLSLTPHQIDDYLSCPENFRYRYVMEVPQPPEPNLMYGSLIHAVISRYYGLRSRQRPVGVEDLLAMIDELWQSDGFISKGQEERRRERAEETVRNFYVREQQAKRLPAFSEKDFKFDLPELKVSVRGRFDAVYQDKQGVEIRDFKTSQVEDQVKADDKAATNTQLAIYGLAWQQLTGHIPERVSLDFVDTGLIGSAVKTKADLEKTVQDIAQVARGLREGYYQAGRNCYYCIHPREVGYAGTSR